MKQTFKLTSILFLSFFATAIQGLKAQTKGDYSYTPINYDIIGQDVPNNQSREETTFFWESSFDYAVYEFSNILKQELYNKKEAQRMEMVKQQSLAKLSIIKKKYLEYSNYPSVITNGWHNAIATDNVNFCKDIKVLIKDNRIIKFVINNYIPLNFIATSEIKNAKNIVTLKNFNGEQLNIVEVYFLYDIDQPMITAEPLKPGYVCFWTDIDSYNNIKLRFDNILMEKFTVKYSSEPTCFSNGMICRILKPGTYSFVALGKGRINWKATIEIKENMCLKYRLGKHHH